MITTTKLDIIFPETHNLKTLAIADVSEYPAKFAIYDPTIEITPPNYKQINLTFSTKSLNLLNSNTLNITCGDDNLEELPDGVWKFKYSIYPTPTYFVEKEFLRVDALKASFENLFLQLDMSENGITAKDITSITQIEFLIQGAIANANNCNMQKALKNYHLAAKLIKQKLDGQLC